ncbi:MAG: class I SAM-dependent methyltransferase [Chloroflexota bacterium]
MERHEFLAALHADLRPRNYLEIGVGTGLSMALSRVPSIGVDPAFEVKSQIQTDVSLYRGASDRFFARRDPIAYLQGGRNPWRNLRRNRPLLGRLIGRPTVDFAFIDGMHLFEFALRDFINVERFASPATVIVLDDMLPRTSEEAARDRVTKDWTGDVYKLAGVLRRYRPDLIALTLDTQPTGLLVVLGADRESSVLSDRLDEIVAANVVDGAAEEVPASVLAREDALDPRAFLATGWPRTIVTSRRLHRSASATKARLQRDLAPLLAGAPRAATSEGVSL